MQITDSFLDTLTHLVGSYGIDRSYIAFRSGHWLRISMAMNLKRQLDLGNPVGDTLWDFNGFVTNCFEDMGIQVKIYQSKIRDTSARKTQALGNRAMSSDVILFDRPEEFVESISSAIGKVMMTTTEGTFVSHLPDNLEKLFDLPLGPVAIEIVDAVARHDTPWNSLMYWGWTFERGEEPTEVEGRGGISAVSGWKAYARWMQGYLLRPKPKAIHSDIRLIPHLIKDRMSSARPYLEKLITIEENENIRENYLSFIEVIDEVIPRLDHLIILYEEEAEHSALRKGITEVYFSVQKTLPIFKSFKNLHHDYVLQRKRTIE